MATYQFKKETKAASIIVDAGLKKTIINAVANPIDADTINLVSFYPNDVYRIDLTSDTVEIWDGAAYVDVTANGAEAICNQLRDEVLFPDAGAAATPTLQEVTDEGNETTNVIKAFQYVMSDNDRVIADETGTISSYDGFRLVDSTSGLNAGLSTTNITQNRVIELPDADINFHTAFTGDVIAGQTMTFQNGILISVT